MSNEKRYEEYISFIEGQMKYFDRKSMKEQKKYYVFSFLSLLCNAVIPIVSVFSSMPRNFSITIASLSASSVIFNGVLMIFNSKNNWKDNRIYFTDLEKELRGYRLLLGEYEGLDEEKAFSLFFERCEAVLAGDRNSWSPGAEKDK